MDKMTPTTAAYGLTPYQHRKVGHAPECETAHCRIAAARRRARGVRIDELGPVGCAAGRSGAGRIPRVLLGLAVRGLDAHGLAIRGLDARRVTDGIVHRIIQRLRGSIVRLSPGH